MCRVFVNTAMTSHDFVHGKRADDGTAEYVRAEKRQVETRQNMHRAQFEIRRFGEEAGRYRSFTESILPSYQEIVRLLKQNASLIMNGIECKIIDARYANRKRRPGVAFKAKWDTRDGYGLMPFPNAEDLLKSGELVFDTQRRVWVWIKNLRAFVKHFGRT